MRSRSSAKWQRRTFRALNQDGLVEILAGITFLICSAFVTNPSLLVLIVVPVFLFGPGLNWLQQRLTYPRIGYAKLAEGSGTDEGRSYPVFALVVFAVYTLALIGVGVASDVTYWRRWAPALAGALCCGGFLVLAGRSGFARHYVYIGACLVGGVLFSLIPFEQPYENVQMFLLALAGLMLLSGFLILVRFLSTHPLAEAEESNGQA